MTIALIVLLAIAIAAKATASIAAVYAAGALFKIANARTAGTCFDHSNTLACMAVEMAASEVTDADPMVLLQHARNHLIRNGISLGSMEEFFLDYYISQAQDSQENYEEIFIEDCEEESEC